MKATTHSSYGFFLSVLASILLGTGCHWGTKPVAWRIQVTKTTPASIAVDLVCVSPANTDDLMKVKPDDYWKPNNPFRQGLMTNLVTTSFETETTFVLQRTNAIWNAWLQSGATELVIMADLTGKYDNTSGDFRRKAIPLNTKAWKSSHRTLDIEIQDQMIKVLTPQPLQK